MRLAGVHDDVRRCRTRRNDPDGAEAGLVLAGSHWLHWLTEACGGRPRRDPPALRTPGEPGWPDVGMAHLAAGTMLFRMGDLDRARAHYQEALSVLSRVGTDHQIGSAHRNLGNIAFARGENDEAERCYETSLACYRRANAPVGIAGCLNNLSVIALAREDVDRVETLQSEALQIFETSGIRDQICLCLFQLGIAAYVRRDYDLSRARLDRARALAGEIDHNWNIMAALTNTAAVELDVAGPRTCATCCSSAWRDWRQRDRNRLPVLEQSPMWSPRRIPTDSASILAPRRRCERRSGCRSSPPNGPHPQPPERLARLSAEGLARARERGNDGPWRTLFGGERCWRAAFFCRRCGAGSTTRKRYNPAPPFFLGDDATLDWRRISMARLVLLNHEPSPRADSPHRGAKPCRTSQDRRSPW